MSSDSATPADSELAAKIEQFSIMFDQACQERHDMGEQKYGPGKFLRVNTLEEAMFEVVDLANYARYTFIRLQLMNEMLADLAAANGDEGQFKKVGEGEWGK